MLLRKHKRIRFKDIFLGLMLASLSSLFLTCCFANEDSYEVLLTDEQIKSVEKQLDEIYIKEALENPNPEVSKTAPFCAIKVFDVKENSNNEMELYVFLREIDFYEEDGSLIEDSGSAGPCLINAERQGDKIIVIDTQYPRDGDEYWDSIEEMFSEKAVKKFEDFEDSYESSERKELEERCYEKARKYFNIES